MSPLDRTNLYDSGENGDNGSSSPETMDLDDAVMTLEAIAEDDEEDESSQESAEATEWPKPPPQFIYNIAAQLKMSTKCRVCGENEDDPSNLLVCSNCGPRKCFHKSCWESYEDHMDPLISEFCEKIEFNDYVWVGWLLDSSTDPEIQEQLHEDDIWSTWFAVPHLQNGNFPKLYSYPQVQTIIRQSIQSPARRHPSLISFIGETGGGKSSLIRALIRNTAPSSSNVKVPVPGNQADRVRSTSGDVHLYPDPKSLLSEVPIFYADCEGLRGSGQSVASSIVSTATRRRRERMTLHKQPTSFEERVRKTIAAHQRTCSKNFDLRWGRLHFSEPNPSITPTAPTHHPPEGQVESNSRSLIVKELYPRLLYAFSDVICFITTNPRATEQDILTLFEWARSGHERTLNQRIRPGLVIVINKDTHNADPAWLDVDYATKTLLASFKLSAQFSELREKWAKRGRILDTAEDLILCYYDSFRVVCIPNFIGPKTAGRIAQQYKALYGVICSSSARLRQKKNAVDMDLDVTKFNAYMEYAIGRLTKDLKSSINFYHFTARDSPIPSTFGEHLTAILALLQKERGCEQSNEIGLEVALLQEFIPYLSSCIISQIPAGTKEQRKEACDYYYNQSASGLEKFRDRYWRCEAKNSPGGLRCKNYSEGHEKGHQFADSWNSNDDQTTRSSSAESVLMGIYDCSYDPGVMLDDLWAQLMEAIDTNMDIQSLPLAAKASGVISIRSNRTCLTCLSNCPTNVLPCEPLQHSICEVCLRKFSSSENHSSSVKIDQCPLGCQLSNSPWMVRLKPKSAGARILTLDGGGVRGVIELRILKRLVEEVGHGIPIQELFDLVVGTSIGGIISLGLFKMNWIVDSAYDKFVTLSQDAFSKRNALKPPVFRNVSQLFCDFRYKTEGIESALQALFGDAPLFGHYGGNSDRVKVGVVSVTEGESKLCLFANYSRNPSGPDDHFQRENDPENDLCIWQAARAVSAAPIYFRPYNHDKTNKTYVDGALQRNNPVRVADEERRLIWRNSMQRPDIIVSVGAGVQITRHGNTKLAEASKSRFVQMVIPKGIKRKISTGYDMVLSTLDCRREWKDYIRSNAHDPRLTANCHRLDIGLKDKPPKIDEVDKIPYLWNEAEAFLESHQSLEYWDPRYENAQSHIQSVARRLVAALFYYEKSDDRKMAPSSEKEAGIIRCRLSPDMQSQFNSLIDSKPIFRLKEQTGNGTDEIKEVAFTGENRSFDASTFSAEVEFEFSQDIQYRAIEIRFQSKNDEWEPIGGF